MDLDTQPPSRPNPSLDIDAYAGDAHFVALGSGVVVAWRQPTTPSYDDCASLVATHGTEEARIDVGSRLCLTTSSGRVVFVTMTSRSENSAWNVNLTVWTSAG